jgi:transposase
MPRPYSGDLRDRVLQACDAGETPARVAVRFQVARASVYLWLRQRREEGRTGAKPMGGGRRSRIGDEARAVLARLLASEGRLTLKEYRERLAAETGIRVHVATIGRLLQHLRLQRREGYGAREERSPPRSFASRFGRPLTASLEEDQGVRLEPNLGIV